eukprot:CAMPEP_0195150520 /NCGR_PEP_ID=MMETSP0448-20130528/178935_1 /TAXON_ID=66468 /ORGANISM="Heterocapsa triquestra, Strain CCMP 448" /LENGTH=73 /DNA_ID=CAMNT_0040189201 /DNA_START=42 /DNA_END=260 /DNA_ORIENTATION=+
MGGAQARSKKASRPPRETREGIRSTSYGAPLLIPCRREHLPEAAEHQAGRLLPLQAQKADLESANGRDPGEAA